MIWTIVKTQIEGYHSWPDAPLKVAFLRYIHRHIFWIELWIEQKHTERDVEYIAEKEKLNKFLDKYFKSKDLSTSCETIAKNIQSHWIKMYPKRSIKVGVWEDNENGTFVE